MNEGRATILRWLGFPSVQIAICEALYLYGGYRMGPFFLVWTSPLLGAAICLPVMALLANLRAAARERVWLPVHGKHFVFKGTTIRVIEDDDHFRWVCLADVRKVTGTTAGDSALAVTYPGRVQPMDKPAQVHIRDDALIEHLGKENNPVALRMRTWVERDIAFAGRRIRERLGIRANSAARDDD